MEHQSIIEQAIRIASFNGIDIFRIKAEKFKTSSIHFFLEDNLTAENVTKNALLPAVMRRGCVKYPTFRDISIQLENLYGASFDCGVTKKGETHILQFYAEFLSGKYIPDGTDPFQAAFELLYGILTEPVLVNGAFREEVLSQEKDKLRMVIEGRVNDKMHYSVERCLEEVCREEPYSLYDYGSVSDLGTISAEGLTSHYYAMLKSFPMKVYLAGSITEDQVRLVEERLRALERTPAVRVAPGFVTKKQIEARQVTEMMNVTQGKLCLGFRTNVPPDSADYPALMVFNGILGGGMHSKLFKNVREKASLAYYAHSRLEKFKGLMVISSGIESTNREKALTIMLDQLEEIRKGNITTQEMDATLKSMETGLKSLGDSQKNIVDFYLSQTVAGTQDSFNDIIRKIGSVDKEQIIRVAEGIQLDTVYFLTGPQQEAVVSQQDGKEQEK